MTDPRAVKAAMLSEMFEAYGREPSAARLGFYLELLDVHEPGVLKKAINIACLKARDWPPGPGVIHDAALDLTTRVVGTGRAFVRVPLEQQIPERAGSPAKDLLSAADRVGDPLMRKLAQRARAIRESGRVKTHLWGCLASYVLAAEDLGIPYPVSKDIRRRILDDGVRAQAWIGGDASRDGDPEGTVS